MVQFKIVLQKFGSMGEKTGWTVALIPQKIAHKLLPNTKKSFRVKGYIDNLKVEKLALIPMGQGDFIIPINAGMRKHLQKQKNDVVTFKIEVDSEALKIPKDFEDYLAEDPDASTYFSSLTMGHKNYFIKWIESAKTQVTKDKRLLVCINALARKMDYSQMLREQTAERKKLFGS
jgi:hypothetical protein